jgi:hypothetical protein
MATAIRNTQRPVSLATRVDGEIAALDVVEAELRGGIRNARHYDALEERVSVIAGRLRSAFRDCRSERP